MAGYMNREIEGQDADGADAAIELTVSIGEFNGVVIIASAPKAAQHALVELDITGAHRLMMALKDALDILAQDVA